MVSVCECRDCICDGRRDVESPPRAFSELSEQGIFLVARRPFFAVPSVGSRSLFAVKLTRYIYIYIVLTDVIPLLNFEYCVLHSCVCVFVG